MPPDSNGSGASPADPDQPTHAPPRPATKGSRAVTSPPGLRCHRVEPSGSKKLIVCAGVWDAFWRTYLAGDTCDVLAAVAPFYAWRALVLASPIWYPHLSLDDRDRILGFAERALAADRFDPAWGPEAMR